MTTTEPLDPQVAELLSAYLDGAVTDAEREAAVAWLERSPLARAEYESLAAVKAALGGMGEVEPPFGFYDRMLRQGTPVPEVTSALDAAGRRTGRGRWFVAGGALVAAAAAAFVVLAGGDDPTRVRPPVEQVAAGTAPGVQTFRQRGSEIQTLRQAADGVQWEELPDGERGEEGGAQTWIDLTTTGDEERVVVSGDGVVITLAADGVDVDELIELGIELLDEG